MEIQLQEFIEQIRQNGVEAAEAKAKSIIEAANEEAQRIINAAQSKADKILEDAKAENERIVKSGEEAIRQAGRNLLISFRESVARELKAVIAQNVATVYSSDVFAQLIVNTVEAWANKPDSESLTILLNDNDLKAIEDVAISALKERMISGVTLKANENFDGGFRIAVNSDGAYYDYSSDAVVDMLVNYLSPKVFELLKEAK